MTETNNDAAFEQLRECVNALIKHHEKYIEGSTYCSYSGNLTSAFTAYASSRREARPEYPVGTVVFVPDGEKRPPKKGEWFYSSENDRFYQAWNDCVDTLTIYRRIDINPPAPAPEKTLHDEFVAGRRELPSRPATEVESLILLTLDRTTDAIDSLRAEVKAGNGGKT